MILAIIAYSILTLALGFSVYQGVGSKHDNIPSWVVTLLIVLGVFIRWLSFDLSQPNF